MTTGNYKWVDWEVWAEMGGRLGATGVVGSSSEGIWDEWGGGTRFASGLCA